MRIFGFIKIVTIFGFITIVRILYYITVVRILGFITIVRILGFIARISNRSTMHCLIYVYIQFGEYDKISSTS